MGGAESLILCNRIPPEKFYGARRFSGFHGSAGPSPQKMPRAAKCRREGAALALQIKEGGPAEREFNIGIYETSEF